MFQFKKKVSPEAGLTILADEQLAQATGGSGSSSKWSSDKKMKWSSDKKMKHHKHKMWDSKTKMWKWSY
jgi:hypothetical protein